MYNRRRVEDFDKNEPRAAFRHMSLARTKSFEANKTTYLYV